MADNAANGAGVLIATDETTINGTTAQVQRFSQGSAPNVAAGTVSISSVAVLLAANDNVKERIIIPTNGKIFIGQSGITTSTGFPVEQGQSFSTYVIGDIYAVAQTGTVDVRYWQGT